MSSVDPWEKATECARAVKTITDPQRRAILSNLQDLWIALANESSVRLSLWARYVSHEHPAPWRANWGSIYLR
jgi:hypothetical protein